MLKITYLEDGIYVEYLQESVEAWKTRRILVSLRAGTSIYVENITASLVLPTNIAYHAGLNELAAKELIQIIPCDENYVEVALSGNWVSQTKNSEAGVFVCELNHSSEYFLYELWQESQVGTSLYVD